MSSPLLTTLIVFLLSLPLVIGWLGHSLGLLDAFRGISSEKHHSLPWLIYCCALLGLPSLFGREQFWTLLAAIVLVCVLHSWRRLQEIAK